MSAPAGVAERDAERVGSTGALVAVAAVGALLVVLAWWIGVRTGWGQQVEDWAFEGRKATWYRLRQVGTRVFSYVWIPAAFAAAAGAVVVGFRRRGLVLAAGVAAVVVVPPMVSSVLKRVIDRPELVELAWANARNSFPSGHAALVAGVSLAWVLVAPARHRTSVSVVASIAVGVAGVAVLGTGWHRASDVVGGVGLAALTAAGVGVVLVWAAPGVLGGRGRWDATWPVPFGLAAMAAIAVVYLRNPRTNPAHPMGVFTASVIAVVLVVSAVPLALAVALDRLPAALPAADRRPVGNRPSSG